MVTASKREMIRARVSPAQKRALLVAAESVGMSLSEFLRNAAEEAVTGFAGRSTKRNAINARGH